MQSRGGGGVIRNEELTWASVVAIGAVGVESDGAGVRA